MTISACKTNEPVFDLESGIIVRWINNCGRLEYYSGDIRKIRWDTTQSTSIPTKPCTCVQDKLEVMYLKKIKSSQWRLVVVVDESFAFKDQVVRYKRNQTKEDDSRTLRSIREGEYDSSVMRKLRRVEKGSVGVTCDVVANTVEWTNKRQGITKVSVCICINLYLLKVIYIHIIPIQVFGSPFVPSRRMRKYLI